jgi:hypothetical protein
MMLVVVVVVSTSLFFPMYLTNPVLMVANQ